MFPRFYPILDTGALARRSFPPLTAAEAILQAGAGILQFRHKTHFSMEVFETARQVSVLCLQAGARLIIDDRADIAALIGAGVHLGQEDVEPAGARSLLGAAGIIGYSTHNEQQLLEGNREPVDYLAVGPIFSTNSKQNPDPVIGLGELRRLRAHTDKRLVAIGGITRETAAAVLAAGADSVAVISDLLPDDPTGTSIRRRAQEWMRIVAP